MYHNDLLSEFYSLLTTRYPRDGQDMSYSQWIETNTRLRGKKFTFEGYEFQRAIADDHSQQLSCIKPSQVGLSEIQIRKFLAFLARNRGVSGIYSMPNEKMYKRLSKTRVKPLVTSEKAFTSFRDDEKSTQSMDLYDINGSFGYFTGMTEGDATSIPADLLYHDEVDLSDQVMIGLYQSRLQNSRFRLTHKFSTPTLPGYAIDAAYQASDQMEYMCRCQSCGHHQIPSFSTTHLKLPGYHGDGNLRELSDEEIDRIDFDNIQIICESCQLPLDVLNPANREWVARYPSRRTRGYRVRPFMTRSLMPAYVIGQLPEMRRLDNIKGYYNTVLGETYSDGSNQLTDSAIRAVMKSASLGELPKGAEYVIGIDVGKVCHVVIGVLQGEIAVPVRFELIAANEIEDWVEAFCKEFKVVAGSMDRFPYTPTADAVFAKSGGKIIPTEYRGQTLVHLKKDEFGELAYAQVNRTAVIDRVVNLIRRQMITLNGYGQHGEVIMAHLKDMVRIEHPEKEPTWEKVTGNDHFFHALAYLQIAPRIYQVISSTLADFTADMRVMMGIIGIEPQVDRHSSDIYRTRSANPGNLF